MELDWSRVHTEKNRAKPYKERLILWRDEGWLTDSNPMSTGRKNRNLRSVPGAFSGMLLDEVRTARTVGMDRLSQQLDTYTHTHTKRWSWWNRFKGWMMVQEMVFFFVPFSFRFFFVGRFLCSRGRLVVIRVRKKIMTSANIHKIWWFPKSDFKHFEAPVFPLYIYRIFAENNFDISFLFCENATSFFSFPGRASWVERNEAQQIKNYSTQISKAVKLGSKSMVGRFGPTETGGNHLFLNGERPCCEIFSKKFHSCFFKTKSQVVN